MKWFRNPSCDVTSLREASRGYPLLFSLACSFVIGLALQYSVFSYFGFMNEDFWLDPPNPPEDHSSPKLFPIDYVVFFPVACVLVYYFLPNIFEKLARRGQLGLIPVFLSSMTLFMLSYFIALTPLIFFGFAFLVVQPVLFLALLLPCIHIGVTYGSIFAASLVQYWEKNRPGLLGDQPSEMHRLRFFLLPFC